MKYLPLLLAWLSISGCASGAFTPYPYSQWGTPVAARGQDCLNVSGDFDLNRSLHSAGPRGAIISGNEPRARLVAAILGAPAFDGKETKIENVIPADLLRVDQDGCSRLTIKLFSAGAVVGSQSLTVQAGVDNSGSANILGEFQVLQTYRGILGADHAPFMAFLTPAGDLVWRLGYEKVGVSLLLPIIPRVHKQFEWILVPRSQPAKPTHGR